MIFEYFVFSTVYGSVFSGVHPIDRRPWFAVSTFVKIFTGNTECNTSLNCFAYETICYL